MRRDRMMFLGLALMFCSAVMGAPSVFAACPAPQAGEPLPPEAQADFLEKNVYWRQRVAQVDQARAAMDLSAVRLLFLGDSITEAWDPEIFAKNFGQMHAANFGVGGDTTQGMLWRLPRMSLGATLKPKLIVLLIGTNDTWPGGDPHHAAIGVGTVVGAIRRLSPASRILLVGLLPRGPDGRDPQRQMAFAMNREIAACADGRFVKYVEPGPQLLDGEGRLAPALAADYLHPTPKAYAILAAALAPAIKQMMADE